MASAATIDTKMSAFELEYTSTAVAKDVLYPNAEIQLYRQNDQSETGTFSDVFTFFSSFFSYIMCGSTDPVEANRDVASFFPVSKCD